MSSENKPIPTNDEIIDEITKDIGNVKCDETACEPNELPELNPTSSLDDEEPDSDKDNSKPKDLEYDFVDEEALKDLEVTLTESEKLERKDKSIELKNEGNTHFKEGRTVESLKLYTEALNLCPLSFSNERSILYSNRAASKAKLGNKESAIDDCSQAVTLNDKYVRAFLRRAQLYEQTEKLDEALEDYKRIVELDPTVPEARKALLTLPPQIETRNEKMKEEMLGQLKNLGNMFLKPFGLSTNNFQLKQDPNTGGYSVNFQK